MCSEHAARSSTLSFRRVRQPIFWPVCAGPCSAGSNDPRPVMHHQGRRRSGAAPAALPWYMEPVGRMFSRPAANSSHPSDWPPHRSHRTCDLRGVTPRPDNPSTVSRPPPSPSVGRFHRHDLEPRPVRSPASSKTSGSSCTWRSRACPLVRDTYIALLLCRSMPQYKSYASSGSFLRASALLARPAQGSFRCPSVATSGKEPYMLITSGGASRGHIWN